MSPKAKTGPHEAEGTVYQYQTEIQQMMFVSGEIAEPLPETVRLIEDIARAQITTIVSSAAKAARSRKNSRNTFGAEDIIFLIRRDRAKQNRLRLFLSWKDVRKNVKDKEGRTADPTADEMLEETLEDGEDERGRDSHTRPGQNGAAPERSRRKRIRFNWDPLAIYMDALGGAEEDADDDEGQHGAYLDQLARLKTADDATRTMTHEQYLFYSECRQASFTYKKPKKFKDWSTLQLHPGARSNVDVVETLGFLAHEIVSQLTETSLAVKAEWDTEMLSKKRKHVLDTDALEAERSLFAGENKNQTPIQAQHVFEAYRRLEEAGQAVHPMDSYRTYEVQKKFFI